MGIQNNPPSFYQRNNCSNIVCDAFLHQLSEAISSRNKDRALYLFNILENLRSNTSLTFSHDIRIHFAYQIKTLLIQDSLISLQQFAEELSKFLLSRQLTLE